MSDEQLSLDGRPAVPIGVTLTPRQELALSFITREGTVPSAELGAVLHEERRARGGRGHSRDTVCEWCGDEGKQMGRRLRELGLVRYRQGDGGGWYVPGSSAPADDRPDPANDPFPEGF